jgi:WD40 repeat protein
VRIWDAAGGPPLATLTGHRGAVYGARFSPDDLTIASAGDDGVRLWDARSGGQIRAIDPGGSKVNYVAWHPDGSRLVAAGDDGVAAVSWAATGQRALSLTGDGIYPVYGAEFTPSGAALVTSAEDNTTRVWDAESGRLRARYLDPDGPYRTAFDRTGQRAVSVTFMVSAKVWRLDTGKPVTDLVGHVGDVLSANWSPDGDFIVTSGADGTARIWDSDGGEVLAILHAGGVAWAASFSPDGRRVLTAGSEGVEVRELPRPAAGAELERLVRCRVPYQVEGERLAPRPRDRSACPPRAL